MLRVGVTGGIGSGKTIVCKVFKNLGVPVFNSDIEAKLIINNNDKVRKHIINNFGRNIFNKNGIIDHKRLLNIVFNDKFALNTLNSIIHPIVRKQFSKWQKSHTNSKFIIQEAAILFESGAYKFLDKIITVYSEKAERIKRIMERDQFNVERIEQIMGNQMDENEKCEKADYIIYNDEKKLLLPQILELYNKFLLISQ